MNQPKNSQSDCAMPIIHVQKHAHNYFIVDKSGIEDNRLSLRARGLLMYFLTKPEDWKVDVRHVASETLEGRDAVYHALRELEQHGYARKMPRRNANGTIKSWDVFIYEVPYAHDEDAFAPLPSNPYVDHIEPLPENPDFRKKHILCGGQPLPENPDVAQQGDVQPVHDHPDFRKKHILCGGQPLPENPDVVEQHAAIFSPPLESPYKNKDKNGKNPKTNTHPAVSAVAEPASPSLTPELLVERWNLLAPPGIAKVKSLLGDRRKVVEKALRIFPAADFWEQCLHRAAQSDFLCGKRPSATHPSWTYSFNWLFQASDRKTKNYLAIMEGRYDNRLPQEPGTPPDLRPEPALPVIDAEDLDQLPADVRNNPKLMAMVLGVKAAGERMMRDPKYNPTLRGEPHAES